MRYFLLSCVAILVLAGSDAGAQILSNGDFEQGPGVEWTSWSNPAGLGLIGTGTFFQSTEINPPVVPYSGQWMGRVGGFSYAETELSRSVVLPNTKPLYLGFYYQTRSANTSECAGLWVGARIRVAIAGQVLTDLYLCKYNDALDWTYGYFDVSAAAGQTVSLVIRADAANSVWSFLYVDDVRLTTSTAAAHPVPLPETPRLDSAFPNPFHDRTTLPVSVSRTGPVRIVVTDLLGRTVAVPVQEILPAGDHLVDLDAAGWSAGTYLVRVETGDGIAVGRLTRM